jgi:capsular polysaccharide biosynthesis protein
MASLSLTRTHPAPRARARWTPIAYCQYLRGIRECSHLLRGGKQLLANLAADSWQVTPGSTAVAMPAISLPGQLDRVTGTAYTDDPARDMRGGFDIHHAPTRALLLKNVYLIDGAIYKGRHRFELFSRERISQTKRFLPTASISLELERAAVYGSFDGNEFFGLWLTDDCTTYPLAAAAGIPVTSNQPASPHTLEYERLLGMTPVRSNAALLREAVFFDDEWGNSASKQLRLAALRAKLLARFPTSPHPGVVILRRNSGKSRILRNELEIAEHLRDTRGFAVVDVTRNSAAEILAACAGAKVLVGIEGSHLMHGLMVLRPGASVLTIHPPYRFCAVIKQTTDMTGLHYGFVVGQSVPEGFTADIQEIERTLDLLPSPGAGVGNARGQFLQ